MVHVSVGSGGQPLHARPFSRAQHTEHPAPQPHQADSKSAPLATSSLNRSLSPSWLWQNRLPGLQFSGGEREISHDSFGMTIQKDLSPYAHPLPPTAFHSWLEGALVTALPHTDESGLFNDIQGDNKKTPKLNVSLFIPSSSNLKMSPTVYLKIPKINHGDHRTIYPYTHTSVSIPRGDGEVQDQWAQRILTVARIFCPAYNALNELPAGLHFRIVPPPYSADSTLGTSPLPFNIQWGWHPVSGLQIEHEEFTIPAPTIPRQPLPMNMSYRHFTSAEASLEALNHQLGQLQENKAFAAWLEQMDGLNIESIYNSGGHIQPIDSPRFTDSPLSILSSRLTLPLGDHKETSLKVHINRLDQESDVAMLERLITLTHTLRDAEAQYLASHPEDADFFQNKTLLHERLFITDRNKFEIDLPLKTPVLKMGQEMEPLPQKPDESIASWVTRTMDAYVEACKAPSPEFA